MCLRVKTCSHIVSNLSVHTCWFFTKDFLKYPFKTRRNNRVISYIPNTLCAHSLPFLHASFTISSPLCPVKHFFEALTVTNQDCIMYVLALSCRRVWFKGAIRLPQQPMSDSIIQIQRASVPALRQSHTLLTEWNVFAVRTYQRFKHTYTHPHQELLVFDL